MGRPGCSCDSDPRRRPEPRCVILAPGLLGMVSPVRWVPPVFACITVGFATLLASCFVGESTSACDSGDDLAEASFRFQFSSNRSSIGDRAAAYFVALEDDQDPGPGLLARFSDHSPPVRSLSVSTTSEKGDRVLDPNTGKPSLIFRIYKRTMLSNSEAIVEGGYYEANLSASWITMRARCQEGTWRVERIGPEKISDLRL